MDRLMYIRYLLLLLSTLVTACTLGPDYEAPDQAELHVDSEFRTFTEQTSVKNEPSFALKNWRNVYQDPQLVLLIEQALAQNLDLATARSRLRQAASQTTIAASPLFPQVDALFETEIEQESGSSRSSDTYTLGSAVSWELDIWGVNRRAVEAAQANQLSIENQLYAAQVSLIGTLASAYFELIDLDNQIAITKETIAAREKALHIQVLRKKNGIISGLEVRQAEVSLADVQRSLPPLELSRLQLENQISLLLGQPPKAISRSQSNEFQVLPTEIPAGLPSDLLRRRPDLIAAEQSLIAANANIGVAEGNFFPKLTLTAEAGFESNDLGKLVRSSTDYWDIVGGVTAPIFNAGANQANLEAAEEAYHQALLNYRTDVLIALQEVSYALSAYQLSKQKIVSTERLYIAARDYLRLSRLQYRNGILGYIDVLDAERQLLDATLSLSQEHREQRVAVALLYKALGGGWEAL